MACPFTLPLLYHPKYPVKLVSYEAPHYAFSLSVRDKMAVTLYEKLISSCFYSFNIYEQFSINYKTLNVTTIETNKPTGDLQRCGHGLFYYLLLPSKTIK